MSTAMCKKDFRWRPAVGLDKYGSKSCIDRRLLARKLLLHLYRFPEEEASQPEVIRREATRLTGQLSSSHAQALATVRRNCSGAIALRQTELRCVPDSIAAFLHRHFHYLSSPRPDGTHLGLYPDWADDVAFPVCLMTFSPFDLPHLTSKLPSGVEGSEVLVLSRLIAFSSAPYNALSYALGKARRWLRIHQPSVKLLISYLDPNVNFDGATYKAANWWLLGFENKERYLYIDSDFVSNREMIDQFGTARFEPLQELLGERIEKSVQPLKPLMIFACFVKRKRRHDMPRDVLDTATSLKRTR